jgi:hypothetical protein
MFARRFFMSKRIAPALPVALSTISIDRCHPDGSTTALINALPTAPASIYAPTPKSARLEAKLNSKYYAFCKIPFVLMSYTLTLWGIERVHHRRQTSVADEFARKRDLGGRAFLQVLSTSGCGLGRTGMGYPAVVRRVTRTMPERQ